MKVNQILATVLSIVVNSDAVSQGKTASPEEIKKHSTEQAKKLPPIDASSLSIRPKGASARKIDDRGVRKVESGSRPLAKP